MRNKGNNIKIKIIQDASYSNVERTPPKKMIKSRSLERKKSQWF